MRSGTWFCDEIYIIIYNISETSDLDSRGKNLFHGLIDLIAGSGKVVGEAVCHLCLLLLSQKTEDPSMVRA